MELLNIEIDESFESNVAHVEISYPTHNAIDTIELGLTDVRAVHDIRITFDYSRDGWSILVPKMEYDEFDDLDMIWVEKSFISC